jgi:hypothetical protein
MSLPPSGPMLHPLHPAGARDTVTCPCAFSRPRATRKGAPSHAFEPPHLRSSAVSVSELRCSRPASTAAPVSPSSLSRRQSDDTPPGTRTALDHEKSRMSRSRVQPSTASATSRHSAAPSPLFLFNPQSVHRKPGVAAGRVQKALLARTTTEHMASKEGRAQENNLRLRLWRDTNAVRAAAIAAPASAPTLFVLQARIC